MEIHARGIFTIKIYTYLSKTEYNIDFICYLWVMVAKYPREYLAKQIVIFLEKSLIQLHGV